jgi:hypothetical protein
MPSMADLSVKKADGTTVVVYNALAPSSGDRTAAQFRQEAASPIAANRPTFTVSSKASANGKARIVEYNYLYPATYTDTSTGITSVLASVKASGSFIFSKDISDDVLSEAAAQMSNVLTSTLIQSVLKSGYAPS